jgi:alkylation response protein AidB-like acyl-CoA dehydrogenase
MDFSLTEDQQTMLDATRRFLQAEYPRHTRGTPVDESLAQTRWTALAGMGLLALPLQPRWGGADAGLVDMALIARELGRHHAGEGLLSSLILAGLTLQHSGQTEICSHWLPRLAEGSARVALAQAEPQARYRLDEVRMRAEARGAGHVLSGVKSLVLDGHRADAWLVLARTQGDVSAQHGQSLFLVPRGAPGLKLQTFPTLDGRHAAHLHFDQVPVGASSLVGPLDGASPLIRAAMRRGAIWVCAESLGAMDSLITDTTEHLMTRKQFGAPLSRFQALQHRMADALIALEESEAITFAAAMHHDDQAAEDLLDRTTAAAKVISGRAGQRISETAIQLHGAMGMTDACRVGHFTKLLWTLSLLFGDVHHHTAWYAEHAIRGASLAPATSPRSHLSISTS